MFKNEWKSLLSNKKLLGSLFVILFIPIIYAGMFLSSNWDPYGKTENLPVAIVNNDKPVQFEGKTLNIGDELVSELKKSKDLDWHFVNTNKANKGLSNGDYYMSIIIPKDFSKNASTVMDEKPKKMNLVYEVNPGRSYFSASLGKQTAANINKKIAESVTKQYTKALFSQMNELGDGLSKAADGAKDLNEGTEKIDEGNNKITENLEKLASSSLTFESGATQLQDGFKQLNNGANDLKDGSKQLNDGVLQYTDGVGRIQSGTKELALGSEELNKNSSILLKGSSDITNGLTEMSPKVQEIIGGLTQSKLGSDQIKIDIEQLKETTNQLAAITPNAENGLISITQEELTKLITSINQLSEGSASLNQGLSELEVGSKQLIDGVNALKTGSASLQEGLTGYTQGVSKIESSSKLLSDGTNELASKSTSLRNGSSEIVQGTEKLANNLPTINQGIVKLTDGASQISNGSESLADGSIELGNGIKELKDGTNELSVALSDGSKELNDVDLKDSNYNMFAKPITVTEKKLSNVPNYGHSLAPYILSLGLFVGCVSFNLIFPISEPTTRPTSAISWWFSKFSIGFIQAALQALILVAIMILGFELNVDNPKEFIAVAIFSSLTSMFLVMFLNIAFGNVGRFLTMIILVLQLASSGGTFPIELTNNLFMKLHSYLPMSYSVDGIRQSMSSALGEHVFATSIIALFIFIVLFNLLILLTFILRKRRVYKSEIAQSS